MIALWHIKALVQKIISFLPWSHRINYFFQKYVSRGVLLDDVHFGLKLKQAKEHLDFLHQTLGKDPGTRVLELGTGWYPVVPLLFYLSASGETHSVDIRSWMTPSTQRQTMLKFKEWKERGLLDEIWLLIDEKRWSEIMILAENKNLADPEFFNRAIGLVPVVGDARNLKLETGSIDYICSNNTFEHIPGQVLIDILIEFKRLLRKGGAMSHFIDMSDHFAHLDHSITIYNYLKFSKKRWAMIDNNIQPQNRMRLRDYKDMYRKLDIPVSGEIIHDGRPEDLEKTQVHADFQSYSKEELAISHATLHSLL